MKSLNFLTCFFVATILMGCGKWHSDNPLVENFIDQLKANNYTSHELPAFEPTDIDDLMKYVGNDQIVINFPINPISSFLGDNTKHELGILILWTIEAIRLKSLDPPQDSFGFASLNPYVRDLDENGMLYLDHSDAVYNDVRQAYRAWWRTHLNNDFSEFNEIDPLSITKVKWH